jgi:hypothetical protein
MSSFLNFTFELSLLAVVATSSVNAILMLGLCRLESISFPAKSPILQCQAEPKKMPPSPSNCQGFPSLPARQVAATMIGPQELQGIEVAHQRQRCRQCLKPMHSEQEAAAFVINKAFLFEPGHRICCRGRTRLRHDILKSHHSGISNRKRLSFDCPLYIIFQFTF